jgi:hypothetical protein
MFSSISWQQYFYFMGISLAIYYLVIAMISYKHGLLSFRQPRYKANAFEADPDDNLLNALRDILNATSHKEVPKEELIMAITAQVKKCKEVNRALITQFIEEAFPQLTEHDRKRIWQ